MSHLQARASLYDATPPRCGVLALVAIAVFAAICGAVQLDASNSADAAALRWIVDQAPSALARSARDVGTWPYTVALIVFEVGLVIALARYRAWRRIGFLLAAVVGSYLLNPVLKLLFARQRPLALDQWAQASGYSFPSGHAMASATVAAAVVVLFWRTRYHKVALSAATIFMLAVGMSRLLIGAHYPTDVLAGWAAGIAWAAACGALILPRNRRVSVDSEAMVKRSI